ncbi:MAG: FAD-dependent oxidoreductase, partial [Actinomycetota bacterium]|nr:FAD-dependent oxidoreductase [Actinomycetota bacterium]
MKTTEIAIVGVGVMGAAAGRALARRGHNVVMLEQFEVGHERGSSHGTSRYRQLAAYPTVEYLELGIRTKALWDELERESDRSFLHRTGNVSIGAPSMLQRQADALRVHEIDCELALGGELRERWPQLDLPQDEPALYQPDGEVIAADLALGTFVASAIAAGAELREHSRVTGLDQRSDHVVVTTDDDEIAADRVIITAGPWVKQAARGVGIELPVTVSRQTVTYFALTDFVPPTITDYGGTEPYALWDPARGLKAAEHERGPHADPDEHGVADDASVTRVTEWVRRLFPTATREPHRVETCIYTNAPRDEMIIDRYEGIV